MAENQGSIIKWTLVNLITLVGLIVLIAVTFALASISTALADDLVRLIGLDEIGWLSPVLRIVPIIFSVGAARFGPMAAEGTWPGNLPPGPQKGPWGGFANR